MTQLKILFIAGTELDADRIVRTLRKGGFEPSLERITAHGALDVEAVIAAVRAGLQDMILVRERETDWFSLSLEAAPVGMMVVNQAGVIEFMNARSETIFGYDRGELLGRSVEKLLPMPIRGKHEHERAAFAANPQARQMGAGRDLFGQHKDGHEIPVEVGLGPLPTSDGTRVIASVIDISERKREEGVKRLYSDLSTLLSLSLDLKLILDQLVHRVIPEVSDWCIVDLIEDQELKRFALANSQPEKERLLADLWRRFPVEVAQAHPVSEVIRTKKPRLIPTVSEELLHSVSRNPEYLSVLKEIGFKSALIVPVLVRNEALGAITFALAESKRIFTERDLKVGEEIARRVSTAVFNARLYQQRQAAIEARDETLSVMSHDLKNPISAVLLSATLLERLLPRDDEKARCSDLIARIRRAADRALRLIQSSLDSAKIEAGRFELELREENVPQIVHESIDLLQVQAAEKGITLTVEVAAGCCKSIRCDYERMLQVFSNLVGNAVKFTPEHGTITVRAVEEEGGVHFSVTDTGPGIPESELPHLFERYWQAKKTSGTGAGLGLYIAQGIIGAHGGRIWVESKVGQGTTFHFTLPIASNEVAPGATEAA